MGIAKKSFYKYCLVPECKNTTISTPDKVFFSVPRDAKIRKQWCKVMRRSEGSPISRLHCCEDHFNIEEDTKNYIQYNIMKQQGEKVILCLKEGVLPHIFQCQKRNMPAPQERMCAIKKERFSRMNEALTEFVVDDDSDPDPAVNDDEDFDSVSDDSNTPVETNVCRVCLALDVKMYNLRDTELKTMFQNITGITINDNNHSVLENVCWECAARLKAAAKFRNRALLSDSLLQDLISTEVQIRKNDITTIKEKADGLIQTSTLTATSLFYIVDIEDQNINQPDNDNQASLSEHDEIEIKEENTVIIKTEIEDDPSCFNTGDEIREENTVKNVEENEINVPIKTEIKDDPTGFNTGDEIREENTVKNVEEDEINVSIKTEIEEDCTRSNPGEKNQIMCSSEDTIVATYQVLDRGIPLLEPRVKIQEENPTHCMSSREDTINSGYSNPQQDTGRSLLLSQDDCEQLNETIIKKESNSEIISKIVPELTTELLGPIKRTREAVSHDHAYNKKLRKKS